MRNHSQQFILILCAILYGHGEKTLADEQSIAGEQGPVEINNWYSPKFEILAKGELIHFDLVTRHALIAAENKQTIAIAYDALSLSDQKRLLPEELPDESANAIAVKTPAEAKEEIHSGKVIAVAAGDLLTLLVDKKRLAIALEGIDAPEKQQPYSKIARLHLWKLVGKKQAVVIVRDRDQKKRHVCALYCDGKYLNHEMLSAGLAWVAKENLDPTLLSLQTKAQEEKRGLWADKKPLTPWNWLEMSHSERTLALSGRKAAAVTPEILTDPTPGRELSFWLNTYSNVRHNNTCEWFGKTSKGRQCTANEGRPCGACGG